jgi:hypothetical protein
MSKKYVIDLPDDAQYILINGASENHCYTRVEQVDDLEELNSDYINEHFGELQDEAYQAGLNDAWEAARKVGHCKLWDDYTKDTSKMSVCALDVLEHYTAAEAIAKLKAYEGNKDEPIKAGDIVERYIDGKLDSKGIYLQEDGGYWRCLFYTGAIFMTFAYPKGQFKKTGKHYDIASILEAMRE